MVASHNYLCNRARRLIGLMYRRFYKNADTKTLLQLYKTFIRPHLEYCSIVYVWDPYLAKDIEAIYWEGPAVWSEDVPETV